MTFEEIAEFKRDFKKLLKKYRTIKDDIDVVKDTSNNSISVFNMVFSPATASPKYSFSYG